jgi:hypothetical protein
MILEKLESKFGCSLEINKRQLKILATLASYIPTRLTYSEWQIMKHMC